MRDSKTYKAMLILLYGVLFLLGIKTLFHGFPDIERFFSEWIDERIMLTNIMKFGTLNFVPTIIVHPPLYHYLTFIPIGLFFVLGKLAGFFQDKVDFVNFYFNNTHYFFLIGRAMSYLFFWAAAAVIFRVIRLFYSRTIAHITVLSYLLIPRFIFDFSTTRPETLLFLTVAVFFYFSMKYYLNGKTRDLLLAAFFLGVSTATKYNALFLGFMFIPLLLFKAGTPHASRKIVRKLLSSALQICLLVFLGFFLCNPFFILQFNKFFHNLKVYSLVEMRHHGVNYYTATFCLTHLQNLISVNYLNAFGFLLLVIGLWRLFKTEKKLLVIFSFIVLIYEVYFGIFQRNASPLHYLNPTLPIIALIFSTGVEFIITQRKKLIAVPVIFGLILSYNYSVIWRGLAFGPTYLQKARYFIEQTIPEFTTISITTRNYLPQLNMTRESYSHLMNTAPLAENIWQRQLDYKEMDNQNNYDGIFRELRIKSLTKKPQYNLLRWDKDIKTEQEAVNFLRNNKVKYILGIVMPVVSDKKISDTEIVSLVKEFSPRNKRVYGDITLYLYKVN